MSEYLVSFMVTLICLVLLVLLKVVMQCARTKQMKFNIRGFGVEVNLSTDAYHSDHTGERRE